MLTPNQVYCVAERLKLPFDPRADDDSSLDPAHLYEFVHQVQKLLIAPPPRPTSLSCITIDISPFRNLQELHVSACGALGGRTAFHKCALQIWQFTQCSENVTFNVWLGKVPVHVSSHKHTTGSIFPTVMS